MNSTSFAGVVCLVELACVSSCAAGPSGAPAERYDVLEGERIQVQAENHEARRRAYLQPRVRVAQLQAGRLDGGQTRELHQVGAEIPESSAGPTARDRTVSQGSIAKEASGKSDTHWRIEEFRSPIDASLLCGAVSEVTAIIDVGIEPLLDRLIAGSMVTESFGLGELPELRQASTIEYTLEGFPNRNTLESDCRV